MCPRAPSTRFIAVLVAAAVCLGPGAGYALAAPDDWSRVVGLGKDTRVTVYLRDGGFHTGWLMSADAGAMTVRSMGEDRQIRREDVQRVIRMYTSASAPIVAAAVAAGAAATAGILYGCSRGGSCSASDEGWLVVLSLPGLLGYIAYKQTSSERTKVVYDAAPVKSSTDLPSDWETIRKALPPSMQGVGPSR